MFVRDYWRASGGGGFLGSDYPSLLSDGSEHAFIQWQSKRGVPHLVAVILTVVVNVSLIGLLVALTVNATMDFLPKAPF